MEIPAVARLNLVPARPASVPEAEGACHFGGRDGATPSVVARLVPWAAQTTLVAGCASIFGGGAPSALIARIEALQNAGVEFRRPKRFLFWRLSSFKAADAHEVAQRLEKGQPGWIQARLPGFDWVPVDTERVLNQLEFFHLGAATTPLVGQPLAAVLLGMQQNGTRFSSGGVNIGAHGMFARLGGDAPGHESLQARTGGRQETLQTAEDVHLLHYLQSGQGLTNLAHPEAAESIRTIEQMGYRTREGSLQTYRAQPSQIEVMHGREVLDEVDAAHPSFLPGRLQAQRKAYDDTHQRFGDRVQPRKDGVFFNTLGK